LQNCYKRAGIVYRGRKIVVRGLVLFYIIVALVVRERAGIAVYHCYNVVVRGIIMEELRILTTVNYCNSLV
jgi:hypothetical protein